MRARQREMVYKTALHGFEEIGQTKLGETLLVNAFEQHFSLLELWGPSFGRSKSKETVSSGDAGEGANSQPTADGLGKQPELSETAETPSDVNPERTEGEAGDLFQNPVHHRSAEKGNETERHNSVTTPWIPDSPEDVDRINIWVKCQGVKVEVEVFPLERMSVLMQEGCQKMGKNPRNMKLVYEGEAIDEGRTVRDCRLRGGALVHLVRDG